jgi:epoxyqueuosine reductase
MVDNLTQALHDFAKRKEIDLLGVTNADDIVCIPCEYDSDPVHYAPCRRTKIRDNTYSPKVIMKSVKAVIITGMYMFGFDKIIPGTLGCPRGNIGPWTRAYVEAGRYATDQVMSFLQNMGYKAVFTNELPYRTLAVKCGLGSIGKNGFLYHEKMGSYIRMGCVLTDAPLETEDHGTQSSNTCGKCNICINACPTGALRGQNDYDADYCLHLWLQGQGIYGENIPPEERHKCLNYIMRTGRCLEVCPRNRGLQPRKAFPFKSENKSDSPELIPLVLASEEEFKARLPYHVYKYGIENIRRNAIIALGNAKDPAALEVLSRGLTVLSDKARGLCAWALGEIGGNEAKTSLIMAAQTETSSNVQKEIEMALHKLDLAIN